MPICFGTSIAVHDIGAGAHVVCIHGALGEGAHFRGVARVLERSHRILAPDLFGDGSTPSAPRGAAGACAFDADVALIESVLASVSGRAHLVGHSYGATLAMAAALRAPDRVASLVVIEPNGLGDVVRVRDDDALFGGFRRAMHVASARFDAGDAEGAAGAIADMAQGPGVWDGLPNARKTSLARGVAKLVVGWERTLARAPKIADAMAIEAPVLAIAGTAGPLHARVSTRQIAALAPNAELVEIEGAGHMTPLSHPRAIAEAIAAFVAKWPIRNVPARSVA